MLIAVIIATLTAGCDSDSSTAVKSSPTVVSSLDLAPVFSQMEMLIGEGTSTLGGGHTTPHPGGKWVPGLSGSDAIGLLVQIPLSACGYRASPGGFTCPSEIFQGPTYTFSYFLYDAAGHLQSVPDAATVASVRTVIDAVPSGLLGEQNGRDHQDMTLSGLLTPTHILNGTGHMVGLGDGDARATISNVTLKAPGTSGVNGPISGTITGDGTMISVLDSSSIPLHVVVTFNGKPFVP